VASDQGEDGEEGDGDGRSFLDEEVWKFLLKFKL
jgi:hypothetical protein